MAETTLIHQVAINHYNIENILMNGKSQCINHSKNLRSHHYAL